MKKILTLLLILFLAKAYSQESKDYNYENFKLENKELKWQKVFETQLTVTELIKSFRLNVLQNLSTDNLQEFENRISFTVNGDEVNYTEYGGARSNTVMFAIYPIDYFVVIDFKNYKYRVTIKKIFVDFTSANIGLGKSDLKEFITKKKSTTFSTRTSVKKGASYYNYHFLDGFNINSVKKENDEW